MDAPPFLTEIDRAIMSYLSRGPHVTLVGGENVSNVKAMIQALGVSVHSWEGDADRYRASLNRSFTTKGFIIHVPPPKGRDAPPELERIQSLVWQKNYAAGHHLPMVDFHSWPSKGELILAFRLVSERWKASAITTDVLRVPYYAPSGMHRLYDLLARTDSSYEHEEAADGSPADGSPADGSPADGSPASPTHADGRPATADTRSARESAVGAGSRRSATSARPSRPRPTSGSPIAPTSAGRTAISSWGPSHSPNTPWNPPWRPETAVPELYQLSAARPRSPTRPRTPRSSARLTLAPPCPHIALSKVWGEPPGRVGGAVDEQALRTRQAQAKLVAAALAAHDPIPKFIS